MRVPRKVFNFDPPKRTETTPEFEVGGGVFHCRAVHDVSSLDVLDYIAGLTGSNGIQRIRTMLQLFNAFIPEQDAERFRETVRGNQIPAPVLYDIASWLLDEYLNFPTRGDEPSSTGTPPAAQPNGDDSSPQPAGTTTG
jgi:hypothetical protein